VTNKKKHNQKFIKYLTFIIYGHGGNAEKLCDPQPNVIADSSEKKKRLSMYLTN
jgi:hypothetical protein